MEQNYKLIFCLTETDFYGFVIEAYRINILKNGLWSMDFKKINHKESDYLNMEFSEIENSLIDDVHLLKEENIIEKFYLLKEKKTTFGQAPFNKSNLSKIILPWVSKTTYEILNKLYNNDFDIYLKINNKDTVDETIIKYSDSEIEPNFCFNLDNDNFTYKLTLTKDNEAIDITKTKLITHTPCYILYENKLYKLPKDFNGVLIKPFQKNEIINIPPTQTKTYLETFVSKIVKKYKAEIHGFSVSSETNKPVPVLSITKFHKSQFAYTISFNYAEINFPSHSSALYSFKLKKCNNNYSFIKTLRDLEEENKTLNFLEKLGFEKINYNYYIISKLENEVLDNPYDIGVLLENISKNALALIDYGFQIEIIINDKEYIFDQAKISTEVSQNKDWFDLMMKIKIGEHEISFQKFIPNIISNNNEFILPNGKIFFIPNEWFSRYRDISILSTKEKNIIKIHKSQFALVKDSINNESLTNLIKKEINEQEQPKELKAELRSYQKNGMNWMLHLEECSLGGCLADDMGLGKTIQILAYILKIKETNKESTALKNIKKENELFETYEQIKDKTHLIIVPLSLIHNWTEEIKKFAPSLASGNYIGADRYKMAQYFKYFDVIITTYGIIRNDSDILKSFNFHTIILDESQNIKNPLSKSNEAILKLNSKQRFILSGTPLENSLTDIWPQLNFINPGILGSFKNFKDNFVSAVEKNKDEDVTKRINKIISPFILRRTKKEVAKELPDLSIKICYCGMSEEQKKLYEKKKSEVRNFLIDNISGKTLQQRNILILSGLMKLRLIANHPKLSDPNYNSQSGKFDEIKNHIKKVLTENHKTIIFSQFVKHLIIVKEYLDSIGEKYVMLTGNTKLDDRNKNINKFQKDESIKIFLISLKAGGVGLNLTKADYVFMLDPWWNPAVESQAINRTHRIGQDKKVMVYKFITEESIEEKIMNLQKKKTELFDTFINSSSFAKLNEDEIIDLFL